MATGGSAQMRGFATGAPPPPSTPRVLDKIAILQTWERQTESAMTERSDGTEFEPMTANEREQLAHLIELRDCLRKELIEYGQIEA